jgi:hypothetical protein
MGITWRLRAALVGGVVAGSLALGPSALAYHQFAQGNRDSPSTTTAFGLTRYDGYVTVTSPSPSYDCASINFDNGNPVYKTMWLFMSGSPSAFVETGTAFQCHGYRFHYADYAYGTFFAYSFQTPVPAGDPIHNIGLLQQQASPHYWVSRWDGVDTDITYFGVTETPYSIQMGLESYDSPAVASAFTFQSLKFATSFGAWQSWTSTGEHNQYSPPILCGGYDSATQYHARENVSPSC